MSLMQTRCDDSMALQKRESHSRVNNPKGIATSSPRLARQRLPWVIVKQIPQPERGCGNSVFVWRSCDFGQNPVGVVIYFGGFPRVARASRPWALGQNPVGIRERSATLRVAAAPQARRVLDDSITSQHVNALRVADPRSERGRIFRREPASTRGSARWK